MPDGSVDFTVRLVNQTMAPAKAIQQSMRDVKKAVGDTQRALAAPIARTSGLGGGARSDWDKMLAKAKRSQAADFARQQAKSAKANEAGGAKPPSGIFGLIGGASHGGGLTGMIALAGPEGAAIAFVVDKVADLIGSIYDAGKAVVELGVKFIETALEAGRFAESSTAAIGYLTDNALHAGTVFDDVRHMAQKLGLDVETTVEGFQKLLAAQFTVGQAKGLIKMGADMRAIGASAEEVQRIIYAMSEIKSMGTLQKRQERMLQMAGISGELIDKALMARTGIKDKASLDKARAKGKIGADTAILAVQDAVMSKTHEKALGDTGATRAATQINGMIDQGKAGLENFWIDAGEKMQPGATRVAKLIAGTVGKIMDDPKVAELGDFLLAKWERFTNWLDAKWPAIESTVIGGLHLIADGIMWTVNALTISEVKWGAIKGAMEGFALGAIGIVGAFVELTNFVRDLANKWRESGEGWVKGLIAGILSQLGPLGVAIALVASMTPGATKPPPGLVPIPGMQQQPYTEIRPDMPTRAGVPASGVTGSALNALAGVGSGKTEAGHETGGSAVHVGELNVHVVAPADSDPNAFAAKVGPAVRAEVQKIFETHG